MPEHLRSLVVIIALALIVFTFTRTAAFTFTSQENFIRRRNLWLSLTLTAFLAHNFWLYLLVATPLLIYSNRRDPNPIALFFSILFVLPLAIVPIPGMGLINFVFDLTHPRVLTLLILLPTFFYQIRQSETISFGRTAADKAFASYLVILTLTYLRDPNLTNFMRQIFYLLIDIFLPYFVISRSLKNLQNFRDALLSFVLATMIIALLAVFESYKSWLLYSPLTSVLGMQDAMTGYLGRDGLLRVVVTAGQPIVLGYLMMVGVGFYLFFQPYIKSKLMRRLGIALLIAGLIAPVSRGPWIGSAVMFSVFIATGPYAARRLFVLVIAVLIALPLIAELPGGERVINLLPYIGNTEKGGIEYREQLFHNSMITVQRNPLLGSDDFLNTPEMQAMIQGEGIIDIVNSYLIILLRYGYLGLSTFMAFFAFTLLGIYRAMRSLSDKTSEEHMLGRVLLSTLVGILTTIVTVSSISYIPIVYLSVAGLGVAYAQMIKQARIPVNLATR
jgi:O-antigen ligase